MRRENLKLNTEIIQEELSNGETVYVARCIELDIASQGATVENAIDNVTSAVLGWLEVASAEEIMSRLPLARNKKRKVMTTQIEVPYGKIASAVGT